MRGSQPRDPLPAHAAGTCPSQEGSACRARREAFASPHPRSHAQEAAGCSLPARLGDGSRSTTSGVWATTTTAVSPSSTPGKRRKAKPHGAAQTVDYEKIATAAVQGMKAADLDRFLVVCALVSDLYCPGFNPRQSLKKDSNLARVASQSKVDSVKIGAAVRAELSKTKNKATKQSQPANKLTTATSFGVSVVSPPCCSSSFFRMGCRLSLRMSRCEICEPSSSQNTRPLRRAPAAQRPT